MKRVFTPKYPMHYTLKICEIKFLNVVHISFYDFLYLQPSIHWKIFIYKIVLQSLHL